MSKYHTVLNQSGLKATNQRLGILEVLRERGHSAIDDIYQRVKKHHPTISLATVYKNIEVMVERGVLLEVPIAGRKSQYEIKKRDHIHLICLECGSVMDEMIEAIPQERLAQVAQRDDFLLSSSQINLYGICHNCQASI
ncbi:MAG TPA: transcriptional repressor [Epsilonproteobacteria bacterium]|nr:transcriptional repressor [Campylobacterota bacterium]